MHRHTDRTIVVRKPIRSSMFGRHRRDLRARKQKRGGGRSKSRRWKDVLRVDVAKGKDELDRQSKQPQSHPCASFRPPPLHLRSLDGADRGTPPHLHSSNVLECEAIVRNKALQMKRLPRSSLNRGGTVTHLEPLVETALFAGALTASSAGGLDRSFPQGRTFHQCSARASLEP